jgi:hypothetical protein
MERLKVYLFGLTVLFASFGAGEAVYPPLVFPSSTARPIVFRLKGRLVWYLRGSPLSSSGAFTEIARRGARASISFWPGIIKYEALWRESLRSLTHRKTNNRSESSAKKSTGVTAALKELLPG